jgi:hypothetical protein
MMEKTIDDMDQKEFEIMMDRFIERDFEEMSVETFFDLLARIDEEKRLYPLELDGEMIDGEVVLALPATAVTGVTIRNDGIVLDGERRIIIHLKQAETLADG